MTEPNPFELLELATPYALNAISDSERAAIDRQLEAAPTTVAEAFGDEVRAIRETMAVISAVTAAEPPDQAGSRWLRLERGGNDQRCKGSRPYGASCGGYGLRRCGSLRTAWSN